jgi:hypothetical protein
LIRHVERISHGIGEPWSRFLYGGSTGDWEALTVPKIIERIELTAPPGADLTSWRY